MVKEKKLYAMKHSEEFLEVLKKRFEKHAHRHQGMDWKTIQTQVESQPEKLQALMEMENTGGEPDVVAIGNSEEEIMFVDCSPESPKGRRSICYDQEALLARKKFPPANSAVNMAAEMGIELLTEEEYRALQEIEEMDLKTSSWVKTPAKIRELGGALFCDRRYKTTFVYHNGADSYYGARGFRGLLRL